MRGTFLLAGAVLVALSGLGCGGADSGSPLLSRTGVFGGNADVPGFGPSRIVVTVGPDGKGRVFVLHQNRAFADVFQPTASSTTLTDESVELRPGARSRVSIQAGSTGAQVEVEAGGTTRRLSLPRIGEFAQPGATPPIAPGSRFAVLTGAQQVVVQVDSVAPDSMGGWSLQGTVSASGGEVAFGGPLWISNLVGDILSIVSEGGMILSGEFGKSPATGSVISFYGTATGPLTELD